jgi:hypothetical protein
MSNPMQSVKLGQSLFQDTFFVANSALTPYRKLRQLELEINDLNTSITRTGFDLRRQEIKKRAIERDLRKPQSELEVDKELLEIDLEEMELGLQQTNRLLEDANARKANFELMKKQLLEETPQEYWDQGFENAELENWTKHFAKQLSISLLTGVPNTNLMEQMTQLPESMVKQIALEAHSGAQRMALLGKVETQ